MHFKRKWTRSYWIQLAFFFFKKKTIEKQNYTNLPGVISCIYEKDWCLHCLHHVLWEETLQNNGENEEKVQKSEDTIITLLRKIYINHYGIK